FAGPVGYAFGGAATVSGGDLNGDGYPDLVITGHASDAVSVLLNNGNGTFQDPVDFGTGDYTTKVSVADLDGDGYPDLVAVNHGDYFPTTASSVSVLINRGDGTFSPKTDYDVASEQKFASSTADLNGDGRPDIVVGFNDGVKVYMNGGNGGIGPPVKYPPSP